MAAQWERWLKYAKARLDDSLRRGNDELDRREAELEARRREQTPWAAGGSGDAPSFDEAKARIEHQAAEAERRASRSTPPVEQGPSPIDARSESPRSGTSPSQPTRADTAPTRPTSPTPPPLATDPGLGTMDFAAQRRAADERLAAMREELGLDAPPRDDDDADRDDEAPPGGG